MRYLDLQDNVSVSLYCSMNYIRNRLLTMIINTKKGQSLLYFKIRIFTASLKVMLSCTYQTKTRLFGSIKC